MRDVVAVLVEPAEVILAQVHRPAVGDVAQTHDVISLLFLGGRLVQQRHGFGDGVGRLQIKQKLAQLAVDFLAGRGIKRIKFFDGELGEVRGRRPLAAETDFDNAQLQQFLFLTQAGQREFFQRQEQIALRLLPAASRQRQQGGQASCRILFGQGAVFPQRHVLEFQRGAGGVAGDVAEL